MFEKCEFWEKWDFENVNFCQKCDFESVNFVKNVILKLWILWKMKFLKCEFLDKLRIFAPMCVEIARLVEWHDDKLADVIWELGKAIKVDE